MKPSPAQEALLATEELHARTATYNLAAGVWLDGALEIGALAHAVTEIERRHAILRAGFRDGSVTIREPRPVALEPIAVAAPDPGAREQLALALAHAVVAAPFDLERGPLLRSALFRLAPRRHLFVLVVHHLVADGWSFNLINREVAAHYDAFVAGRRSELPALAMSYFEAAERARASLTPDARKASAEALIAAVRGAEGLLLPADFPRRPERALRGAIVPVTLDAAKTSALRSLAYSERATLYIGLLAAFAALLGRWSGRTDFVVASPMAGRGQRDVNELVGFFVNTVQLRADLRGEPSFLELVQRMKAAALAARARQHIPVHALTEELAGVALPVPRVALALQPMLLEVHLANLDCRAFEIHNGASKFDLSALFTEHRGGLVGWFEYDTDLFLPETIEAMAARFARVVDAAVAAPRLPVGRLDWLTAADRERVLHTWNATEARHDGPRSLHGLIEAQVRRTPEAVAVVCEGEPALSYSELDARANRLAHHLRRLGVGPDVLVGVFLERSAALSVALLGILKAGGAYVPLDPEYPPDRLSFMLDDARPLVVVTAAALAPRLPAHRGRTVRLDAVDAGPAHAPDVRIAPEALAYVIYTSGSTGRPKGAMNTHAGIANRLQWMQAAYGLAPSDVVLQKTPFSFDVSVWELFWPLMQGARLVFARPGGHRDSAYLAELIERRGVTTLHFVPSMLQIFLDEIDLGARCPSLSRVVCSGEALPAELARRWFATGARAALHNLYGPTEAAVDATAWTCDPRDPRAGVPIGRPIANMRTYVLDAALEPQPVGVAGELYLGGIGVARGYLHRPGLTAERFIPDRFSPGGRLYKTGDLARWLPDGSLEFLGRNDEQIKLHGHRIELGEVTAAVCALPRVHDAHVVVRDDAARGPCLIAYWRAVDGAPPCADSELREPLRAQLPAWMLPAAFVRVEAWPLSPNGKLDRGALPAPVWERQRPFAPPRDPTEQALAAIWSEVLGMPQVGIDDDFFDLGGHSMLAMAIASRARDRLGGDVSVRAVLERRTIAALAGSLHTSPAAPPLVRAAGPGPHPLSFAQDRLWRLERTSARGALYNTSMSARIRGPLDISVLTLSMSEIMRRHEILRASFHELDGRLCQRIAAASPLEIPVVDLRAHPSATREAELLRLQEEVAQAPFDLASAPLLRAVVFRITDNEQLFLTTMHHIISDGWSMGVVLRELSVLYGAFARGEPSPLPPLPFQYTDFAAWQSRWLTDEVLEPHAAYWRSRLHDAPAPLEIPHDWPRAADRVPYGRRHGTRLALALTRALDQLGQRDGATLFMTMFAAYALLLHRLTGETDIVVGIPVSSRPRAEFEPLVGLFLNNLVLRVNVSGDCTFHELLRQVRRVTLDAYEHQSMPFDKLLHELGRGNKLPLFRLFFNMVPFPEGQLAIPGLVVEAISSPDAASKMDVSFYLVETSDGIALEMVYDASILSARRAAEMLRQFCSLLAQIVERPGASVAEYSL